MIYQFPVKSSVRAREVTEADFDIKIYPELYVNLDSVRISEENIESDYRRNIKSLLNINTDDRLEEIPNDYIKILFSGHRGSGKTVEMRKFHEDMLHPSRYFSILIELETELAIDTFQFEDYFILIIMRLGDEIKKHNLPTGRLNSIIEEWLSDAEIQKEITKEAKLKNTNEVGAGFSFFDFLKAKFNLKMELAAGTKIATKIREVVKKNPLALIEKFNTALIDIRHDIERLNQGKDILFIIDGSEKIPVQVYERLFIKDAYIFRSIHANIISTLPIHALYNLEYSPEIKRYNTFLVPVVKITDVSIKELRKIITVRISEEDFFEDGILDYFVEKSGGVVREITKIVNAALMYSQGKKITRELAEKTTKVLGTQMDESLTSEQYNFLKEFKNGNTRIRVADEETGVLFYSLVLLKYNGVKKIHPLLYDFI